MDWEPIGIAATALLSIAALTLTLRQQVREKHRDEREKARDAEAQAARQQDETRRDARASEIKAAVISEVHRQLERIHFLAGSLVSGTSGTLVLPPVVLASMAPTSTGWHGLQDQLAQADPPSGLLPKATHFFSLIEKSEELFEKLEAAAIGGVFKPSEPPYLPILVSIGGTLLSAEPVGKEIVLQHGSPKEKQALRRREKTWKRLDATLAATLARKMQQ